MDTPNTRSRRKREAIDGPDSPVSWAQDEGLRRTVLLASESGTFDAIRCSTVLIALSSACATPPSPTQQPRPITIRTPHASLSLSTPTTKRPRRNRSLPLQQTTPQKDREKLDLLLGQVQARLGSQGVGTVLGDRTNAPEKNRLGPASGSKSKPRREIPKASSTTTPLASRIVQTHLKEQLRSPAPPTVDPKAPSQPEGDDSFDSIDGLFANGGQDIDDLLASL
jgi:hypothetical protein